MSASSDIQLQTVTCADASLRVREQKLRDLGSQLQVMVDENQHLRSGRPAKPPPAAPATMDSNAVIDHRLLLFKDIQVCTTKRIDS